LTGRGGRGGEPAQIGEVLDHLAHDLDGASSTTIGAIVRYWPEIVGAELAEVAHPGSLSEGVLTVVVDDPAVAIAWLLANGAERVAYVDVDVHHGDGPQAIFWDDPRVLTVSIHEYSPGWFFPGTGAMTERGGPGAPGSAVNIPMPPFTGDEGWLSAFHAVVPEVLRRFGPQVLVTQLGADAHHEDPLANLRLTTAVYRAAARTVHELAHELCDGRWVATGGGGYGWARAVPRIWTLWFAEMADAIGDLPDALPPGWVTDAHDRLAATGDPAGAFPTTFSEDALARSDADDVAIEVGVAVAAMVGA